MSKQTQGSMGVVGAIAAGVFVVAIVALMVVGDFAFSPALFLAIGVAAVVALFLVLAFHRPSSFGGATMGANQQAVSHAGDASAQPSGAASAQPEGAAATTHSTASAPAAESTGPASEGDDVKIGTEPVRLHEPREGSADDLKKIKGVGPKLEEALHGMGIFHMDQIAAWTESEVAWMDENLVEFRGRVSRDDWVGQARQFTQGSGTSGAESGGQVYH